MFWCSSGYRHRRWSAGPLFNLPLFLGLGFKSQASIHAKFSPKIQDFPSTDLGYSMKPHETGRNWGNPRNICDTQKRTQLHLSNRWHGLQCDAHPRLETWCTFQASLLSWPKGFSNSFATSLRHQMLSWARPVLYIPKFGLGGISCYRQKGLY